MSYTIRHRKTSKRPWKIVNTQTGKTVGSSLSRRKAMASIGHRMDAEARPKAKNRSTKK